LPWPEGQPVLEKLVKSPLLFILAAGEHEKAKPEVADWLFEPARFRSVIERATDDDATHVVQRLLYDFQIGTRSPWSLLARDERTRKLVTALRDSTNAVWRAAAVWVLTRRDAASNVGAFDKALKDSNACVRVAAVQGLARSASERTVLEARLGPFVGDSHLRTSDVAALALLEPALRALSGLQFYLGSFQFEEIHASASESYSINEERPLTMIETKPKYLDAARENLLATNGGVRVILALLLAQHGDFSGIDRLLARQSEPDANKTATSTDALLTGIALSRDTKYISYLRGLIEQMQQD